jgi:hypothetical protein
MFNIVDNGFTPEFPHNLRVIYKKDGVRYGAVFPSMGANSLEVNLLKRGVSRAQVQKIERVAKVMR